MMSADDLNGDGTKLDRKNTGVGALLQSPILECAQNEDSNVHPRSLGNSEEKSEGSIIAICSHQGHERVVSVERV